jgi:hypothetical protein
MGQTEMVQKLAQTYHNLTKEAVANQKDQEAYKAILNHRFGIRLAAVSLGVWDQVQVFVQALEDAERK